MDKASKAVLHNIEVIATILKNAVPEYRDYSKKEIMEFIDRDSFRDDMEVSPGRTNTEFKGDSTEYIALGEKTANFDYVFSARNPGLSEGKVDALVMQNPFGMGYATIIAAARAALSMGNEAVVDTGYTWLTRDNLEDETIQKLMY